MKLSALLLSLCSAVAAAAPLEVRVDPRVELMATLFRLAEAPEYSRGSSAYVQAVKARFAPFREHPAVVAVRQLRKLYGMSFDGPMTLAVYLDPATLQPIRPLSPAPRGLDGRWKNANIDDFLARLRAFDKESEFRKFLAEHAGYFARVEERFRALADKHDLRPWLDGYYGPSADTRLIVIPGLQTGGSNFGLTVVPPAGGELHLQVLSLDELDGEGLPVLGDATLGLWVHEASHPHVNPLVDQHLAELRDAGDRIYKLVGERMKKMAYTDARVMLCEALVRASVILYSRDKLSAAAAAIEARDEDARGFFFAEGLADTIDAARRKRHATLAQAMPDVVAFLRATADRVEKEGLPRRPFRGPVDAVYAGREIVYVASPALVAHVGKVKAELKAAAAPLLAADKVGEGQLKGATILFGAPATNPLVARILASHGESVGADSVTVDGQTFQGKGLVLITSHPSPFDPSGMTGVVVYTSARDEDIVDINRISHGWTDWVVAQRLSPEKLQPVARGNHPPR